MPGKRKLPSFIDAFLDLVLPKGAPEEFALWTALWMLGAAAERRVFTFTKGEQLFPNLFVFLVGPPGWGKGLCLEPARRILSKVRKNQIGASSMTSASLADTLKSGHRTIIDPRTQSSSDYWVVNVLSPELQVLMPEHDTSMLGKLTYLYDGQAYSESRRGNKEENTFELPRVLLSIIGGTTPEHLFSTFPETAFKTGFFSRVVMIWGGIGKDESDLFTGGADEKEFNNLETLLTEDAKIIAESQGKFLWHQEAKDKANAFYKANRPYGGDPVPSHPRLLHYSTRRTQHLVKLMMLRGLDLGTFDLTGEIYDWAYETLIAAEAQMPEIFKEQNQGGETQTVNDLHHELMLLYLRTKKPIPRATVYQLFGSRVQAFKIEALIKMAVTGGWLLRVQDEKLGACYVPRAGSLPTDTERKMQQ